MDTGVGGLSFLHAFSLPLFITSCSPDLSPNLDCHLTLEVIWHPLQVTNKPGWVSLGRDSFLSLAIWL